MTQAELNECIVTGLELSKDSADIECMVIPFSGDGFDGIIITPEQHQRGLDAIALLRKLEWNSGGTLYVVCPSCDAIAPRDGGELHGSDCELNRILKGRTE